MSVHFLWNQKSWFLWTWNSLHILYSSSSIDEEGLALVALDTTLVALDSTFLVALFEGIEDFGSKASDPFF